MMNKFKFKKFSKLFIPYKTQLSLQQWTEKANEIKKRDFFECNDCGSEDNLEVHHIVYIKDYYAWEYPNNYLITLCGTCHENEHKINFGKHNRLSKYYIDIKNKTDLFPIWFNSNKFYKKDCSDYFLQFYICREQYDKYEQGIYVNDNIYVHPND